MSGIQGKIAAEAGNVGPAAPVDGLEAAAATRARAAAAALTPTPAQGGPEASSGLPPRPDRKPFGAHEQQLASPAIPGFHQHWFNDSPGRIARAKQAGYEHVLDESGEPIRRVVDKREGGGGMLGYLMKIPLEWYRDDMQNQQAELEAKLSDIREGRTKVENSYVRDNHRVSRSGSSR